MYGQQMVRPVRAPLSALIAAGIIAPQYAEAMPPMRHSVGYGMAHVGANPYQNHAAARRRVGAPIIPGRPDMPYPSFATAQGGNPALIPNRAWSGTRAPLPFPASSLGAAIGDTGTSSTTSQGIFRASRMIVAVSTDTTPLGTTVAITSLFVGSQSCLVNNNPLTCALFQPNGVDCAITFPTAGSGITISVSFANLLAAAAVVLPAMLGEYVQGGDHVIAG
jgi:hypothetical protein